MTAATATDDATAVSAFAGTALPPGGRLKIVLAGQGGDAGTDRIEHLDDRGAVSARMPVARVVAAVPCFAATSSVATSTGTRPVETLAPGDRIVTRDNGVQRLAFVGRVTYDWRALGLNPLLRPIRIARGALGNGLPEQDLVVSPGHRMLVSQQDPATGALNEAFVPAWQLRDRPGISVDAPTSVTYFQLLFDRHEVVLAEGAWSESFLPDPAVLSVLGTSDRARLVAACPDALTDSYRLARPLILADQIAALTV